MSAQFQILKRAEASWDIVKLTDLPTAKGSPTATIYETVARVTLDVTKDRYFVHRPVWNTKGSDWTQIPKPYLNEHAAFRAVIDPPRKD